MFLASIIGCGTIGSRNTRVGKKSPMGATKGGGATGSSIFGENFTWEDAEDGPEGSARKNTAKQQKENIKRPPMAINRVRCFMVESSGQGARPNSSLGKIVPKNKTSPVISEKNQKTKKKNCFWV
jgi:hypothetical protein